MKKQSRHQVKNKRALSLFALSSISLLANLLLPELSFGQTDIQIDVTRTSYLSFASIPPSLNFGSYLTSGTDNNVFSNNNGSVGNSLLEVHDTRGSGGFVVQAQAAGPFTATGSPFDTISDSNLRMVTSTSIGLALDALIANNVFYLSGYVGTPDAPSTHTIQAPLNSTSTNFGTLEPFDEVENLPINNHLDTALTVLDGCLTASEGRVGYMGVGVAYTLKIPKFQPPGAYSTIVTYTITDDTPTSC